MNESVQNTPLGPRRTALVLGGGGSAGNAWLLGVIAGLVEAGLDVTDADLIVGTSAGSTAAAQITGARPADLLHDILSAPTPVRPHSERPAASAPTLTTSHLERFDAIIAASTGIADMRRRAGEALAADAASAPAAQARWREIVAARLPRQEWPTQRVQITAVDARTGEPVVFDRDSSVDLVDAVAASCAGGLAYDIGDDSYIDGGYRANADNADLAIGYERVLVLSPLGGATRTPAEWGTHLATQVDALRAHGSRVETVFPDAASVEAFDGNLMNPSTRPPAARAGCEQGRGHAERLRSFWHGGLAVAGDELT